VATVVSLLTACSLFLNLTTDAQGAVNAALVAVGGLVAAALVRFRDALPLLTGVGKAVIAVLLAFGIHLAPSTQAGVMAVLTVLTGLAVQGGVIAPPPRDPFSSPGNPSAIPRQTGGTL
jgi:predicted anti-sigma-YlaC factor YlaD